MAAPRIGVERPLERHPAHAVERRPAPLFAILDSHVEIVEHTFDGVRRITLPMTGGPRHVHCYVIEGDDGPILVDTGYGGLDSWPEAAAIVLTHMHPDHVGGAQEAHEATGAEVHQGALDYAQTERVWGSMDWPHRIVDWFEAHGVPPQATAQLVEQGHAFRRAIRFHRGPSLLYEGSVVGGWRVLELPGHADGHIALERDGVLIAGDTLLATITPAVGLYPESRPDPLADYLHSLERIVDLAPRIAYGGHGDPVEDPAGARARSSSTTRHGSTRPRRRSAATRSRSRSASSRSRGSRRSAGSPSPRRSRTSSGSSPPAARGAWAAAPLATIRARSAWTTSCRPVRARPPGARRMTLTLELLALLACSC